MTARTIRRLAGVTGILAMAAVSTADAGSDVKSLDEALALSKERGVPVMLEFGTQW